MATENKKAMDEFFANDDNFSFDFTGTDLDEQSGELTINLDDDVDDLESSNNLNADDDDDSDESVAAAGEENDDTLDPNTQSLSPVVEGRFKALETSLDSIVEVVKQLGDIIKQSNGHAPANAQQDDDTDDDFEFADPKAMKKYMAKVVQEAVAAAVQPMQNVTKEQQLRNEYNGLVSTHTDAVVAAAVPHMAQLLKGNPNLSMTDAFNLVQNIRGTAKPAKTATSDGANAGESKQVPSGNPVPKKRTAVPTKQLASTLTRKADDLKTERGVSAPAGEKRAASIEGAIDDAFRMLRSSSSR